MELIVFLKTVITTETGYFCLAYADVKNTEEETVKTWREEFYKWPSEAHKIVNRVNELGNDKNIYFSPYLFSERSSTKDNALSSRTIVADLDDANVLTLPIKPTILVETSPDRHQGYWILKDELDLEEHEQLSKKMTYIIPRCDRTGWFRGKKVRIPGTMNLKYFTGPKLVKIVDQSLHTYKSTELLDLPSIEEMFGTNAIEPEETLDWIKDALALEIGPQELLTSIRSSMPIRVVAQYNMPAPDRSTALWALMMSAFRAGLDKERVFHLAYNSVNNKFKDLRYGGVKELGKDVLRAELAINVRLPDIKSKIADARRLQGSPQERSAYIANLVREHLDKIGTFSHTMDDMAWYVRTDNGKPVMINVRSDHLKNLIDVLFGVNASEREASYIYQYLQAYVSELPAKGEISTLSHYDHDTRTFMLHTGKKDILEVSKFGIKKVSNGYADVIFPWVPSSSVISPKYQSLSRTWDEELFDGCLDNIIGIKPKEAQAVLKVWLLTVLLRDGIIDRPILALFGQPGSGKSFLFRRIYALLYGRTKSLNRITTEDHFDYALASEPLVVMDNVDTYAKWLPDRIATSAADSQIIKRKLFTDSDIVVLKCQAMLGITAHNPKFGREDVTDRLILFTFERLQHFDAGTDILNRIIDIRDVLWGAILQDIERLMVSETPKSGWAQFRIEDFAKFGYWIATSLGIQDLFNAGLEKIRLDQKAFVLEEDGMLVDAIRRLILNQEDKGEDDPPWRTPGQLWSLFEVFSGNAREFQRKYASAVALGKKLWTMQDSLREIFDVQFMYNPSKGARQWKFNSLVKPKVEVHS